MLGTANTMACICEALGMSLPGCATTHAVTSQKLRIAKESGRSIMKLVKKNFKPSKIMTYDAFQNAVIVDVAIGGSLNTVLHIPAIANEMNLVISLELFDEISRMIPQIVALKPSGLHTMYNFSYTRGLPALICAFLHIQNIGNTAVLCC